MLVDTYLYKTEFGLIISGRDSGYPNMHLTRFNTNSTKSLWIGCLKNLDVERRGWRRTRRGGDGWRRRGEARIGGGGSVRRD